MRGIRADIIGEQQEAVENADRERKKNMKTIKLLILGIIASSVLAGCVSHTHERVVVEKEPVATDRTIYVAP